ncbi:MAG: radical SAM protein [Thermoplasmata archaeon]
MRIIEVFRSIQGEGPLTGVPTTFVRTARCNLRCAWCDTPYSFGPGTAWSLPRLLREVRRLGADHVCLTGGEPLLQSESVDLVRALAAEGATVVIETGGSLDVSPYLRIPRVILSVDVKCPSSRMERANRWANLPLLRRRDVVKFVVADGHDLDYVGTVLREHPFRAQAVLQPVWGADPRPLAERVLAERMPVRVMLQTHKVIWGDVPGR